MTTPPEIDVTPATVRIEALLLRVAMGMTDEQDAEWLRNCLLPTRRQLIYTAFADLAANAALARQVLAADVRQRLARELWAAPRTSEEACMEAGTWFLIALVTGGFLVGWAIGKW